MMRYMPAHWHTSDSFELYYVFSGECPIHFPGETVVCHPGSVLIAAPGALHATPCYGDDRVLMTSLVRASGGCVLTLNLDCTYEGLRFIPLSPPLESNTVLVWKKAQTFSAAAAALIEFSEKYISGIQQNLI